MNPDVVLVKKAVLGEDSDPPRQVRRRDIISDHQQGNKNVLNSFFHQVTVFVQYKL